MLASQLYHSGAYLRHMHTPAYLIPDKAIIYGAFVDRLNVFLTRIQNHVVTEGLLGDTLENWGHVVGAAEYRLHVLFELAAADVRLGPFANFETWKELAGWNATEAIGPDDGTSIVCSGVQLATALLARKESLAKLIDAARSLHRVQHNELPLARSQFINEFQSLLDFQTEAQAYPLPNKRPHAVRAFYGR